MKGELPLDALHLVHHSLYGRMVAAVEELCTNLMGWGRGKKGWVRKWAWSENYFDKINKKTVGRKKEVEVEGVLDI